MGETDASEGAAEYLKEHGVEQAVASAVTATIKRRPADPVGCIGDFLAAAAVKPTIKVGDTFPMDVVVHQGFAGNTPDAPKKMSSFLSGKKCLVVSLPGAFTPT